MNNNDEQLRYPIGKFAPKESYSKEELAKGIESIEGLPEKVKAVIAGFSEKQWATRYREGGWTARQVVHHLADSHMNAYIRIKWTLTEETPIIKAYNEKAWAETPEVDLDPQLSLNLLSALHVKWAALLKRISSADLHKEFTHPDTKKQVTIERMIALYSWHGEHHLGHLKIIGGKP